jgi:hypothetical protein
LKDVPSIFTTFMQYEPEAEIGLHLLTPLTPDTSSDAAHAAAAASRSVFLGYFPQTESNTPPGELHLSVVAKLVYRHYGVAVHQALHQALPTFAPELLGYSSKPGIQACVHVMEYLRPPFFGTPGWLTLDKINQDRVADNLDRIYPLLSKIVNCLAKLRLVHGDLHPNNLMIKMSDRIHIMQPVEIRVVDFEWADKVGVARYPQSLDKDIGYPGEPGSLIGAGDDRYMIHKWQAGLVDYRNKLRMNEKVCNSAQSPF